MGNAEDARPELWLNFFIEWVSGDRGASVKWSSTNTGDSIIHQAELEKPVSFAENKDQSQDCTVYYSMPIPASTLNLSDAPLHILMGYAALRSHVAN